MPQVARTAGKGLRFIADDRVTHAPPCVLLSLLFAPGLRPHADAVAALAGEGGAFAVSHRPPDPEGWVELLINGLTFDLRGLEPAAPAAPFGFVHRYALPEGAELAACESVTLSPGPHLAGAEAMLPVVRGAVRLACALAKLSGCAVVGWRPARVLAGADYFRRIADAWGEGGPFPALGLTALTLEPDGAVRSEGLAFLIDRELVLTPDAGLPAERTKLAVRLIDHLVAGEPRGRIVMPSMPGIEVMLEDDAAARLVRARRLKR